MPPASIDPMDRRKADKLSRQQAVDNTFSEVAKRWWAHWSPSRSPRHAEYVIRRLESDVFPVLGDRRVDQIQAPELVKMIKAIEERGALDIAKRSLQTCGQIFRYAIAHGQATRNPATEIRPGDILTSRKKQNYARLDAKELPDLLRHIEVYQGSSVTRLAMKLIAMTFVRTSELIGARWEEFDLDNARWDIPAERMKMKVWVCPAEINQLLAGGFLNGVVLNGKSVSLRRTYRQVSFPQALKHVNGKALTKIPVLYPAPNVTQRSWHVGLGADSQY